MKRIWFTQQQPFDFMPLKAGLKIISEQELSKYSKERNCAPAATIQKLCPKIFTIRTRPMKGHYRVVQGGRFNAEIVYPAIEFTVPLSVPFDLKTMQPAVQCTLTGTTEPLLTRFHAPELDLGIVGTTEEMLRDVLLKSYKDSTINTKMYLNKLEPIR